MKNPIVPAVIAVALFILLGESLFGLFSRWCDPARSDLHYSHHVAEQNWMRVRVDGMPEMRTKSVRYVCEVLEIGDSAGEMHTCKGKILLYIEKPTAVTFGDELLVLASPDLPSGADNPHQFDYRKYLKRKNILYTDYVTTPHYRITGHDGKGFRAHIARLRQQLVDVIHFSRLTPSQQGIAEALFLGLDDDLDEETEEHFNRAGITHLLCVSGLHVGLVAVLAGWCLSFLSNRRRNRIIKGCFQLAVIWFFVVLTGMAPGTMRAGIMFSFITVGNMFFTRPPTLNAVGASALVLLVCRPLLLFDVGFQLSYSAVIGIIQLNPAFERLIPIPAGENEWQKAALKMARKLRSLLCVSLSAQIATAPFILYYFHRFPIYFLVANMTIIPFAMLLLGSVILMVAVAWWPCMFRAIGVVVSAELSVTERITSAIASWPHSMIESIYFDTWMLVLAYAILFAAGLALTRRRWEALAAALACSIALTVYAQRTETRCAQQLHYAIYNLSNRTAIEFFVGHESYLLCDSNIANRPQQIDFQTANNLIWRQARRMHILSLDSCYEDSYLLVCNRFVHFNGTSIRIVDRSNRRERFTSRPGVDYLLLRESPYITIGELLEQYDFDTVVIASQNSMRRRQAWVAECDSVGVPYINISK